MKDGQLQQFDRPEMIYDRLANRFVASFLGVPPINFLVAQRLPPLQSMKGLTVSQGPDMLTLHVAPPKQSSLPLRSASSSRRSIARTAEIVSSSCTRRSRALSGAPIM